VWYYKKRGHELGPVSLDELHAMAGGGDLGPADMVWMEGTSKWLAAGNVPGLFPDKEGSTQPMLRIGGRAPSTQMALPALGAGLFLEERPGQWYYAQSRPQRIGPFTDENLQQLATSGALKPTDMVWLEGTPHWAPAGRVPGLFPERPPPGVPSAAEAAAATSGEFHLGVDVAIACRKLSRAFGQGNARTLALRGVDLEIYAGMMTLIVGPSGCGKTTLLSIVAGTLEASEGRVELFGQDLMRMTAAQKTRFRRENIGFVFQQFNLLPALTAVQNAAMPLLIAGWSRRKAVAQAAELLKQVGMEKRLHYYPSQLSGGQQQRVAFARALTHEPRLLVCDEPTSALDAETGQTVMKLLKEVAVSPDRAVIVVTHDSRIFEYSDRTIHMEDGRVVTIEERPGLRSLMSVYTSDRLQPVEIHM
jgi:putative ABC transport system ATP-binding protein